MAASTKRPLPPSPQQLHPLIPNHRNRLLLLNRPQAKDPVKFGSTLRQRFITAKAIETTEKQRKGSTWVSQTLKRKDSTVAGGRPVPGSDSSVSRAPILALLRCQRYERARAPVRDILVVRTGSAGLAAPFTSARRPRSAAPTHPRPCLRRSKAGPTGSCLLAPACFFSPRRSGTRSICVSS